METNRLTAAVSKARRLAIEHRSLIALRCGRANGEAGLGLAHACADMMLSGEAPVGWPIAEIIACIDRAGADDCRHTARVRAQLVEIAESIADAWLASDEEETAAAA